MDPLAFRIANALVGNPVGTEALEITLSGPDLQFLAPAVISLCGAPIEAKLDNTSIPMWSRIYVSAGQRLTIGKTTGGGCRAYLAVWGGFPNVAKWFGSKSTAPMVGVGGYQGRQLASGDLLAITDRLPAEKRELSIPERLIPKYPSEWELLAMPGPYDEGYITPESIDTLWGATWTVSHNAARGGIRLIGAKPIWSRPDGGEGGSHPSNVIEYGYPLGALNWTGDDPVIFPVDAPDFGGFVCSQTVVKASFWQLGQIKAGDTVKFRRVSLESALSARRDVETFVDRIVQGCADGNFDHIAPLKEELPPELKREEGGSVLVHQIPEQEHGKQPLISYRQVRKLLRSITSTY